VFEPLGMTHTFIYNPAKGLPDSAAISYKYNWVREPDMFADGVYGDKNVYSTVEDMYRWDQSFYHNILLSNETIELAYGPCSFEKPGVKNYGLGWRMLCYPNGNKIIYHNGWWHGNNTSFYRFIKENMTIVVLGNRYTTSIYHQAPKLYSIVKHIPVMNGFDTEE
jgi:CubicO group peptidase (beta-lactamase class C family)